MAEFVNLRTVRKRKARAGKERAAAENRALHGRSKGEKRRQLAEAAGSAAFLAGHRLERDGGKE